jgi:hypothetical protein
LPTDEVAVQDAVVDEDAHVVAHGGLGDANAVGEVAHERAAVGGGNDHAQQSHAGRVGERPRALGHAFGVGLGDAIPVHIDKYL